MSKKYKAEREVPIHPYLYEAAEDTFERSKGPGGGGPDQLMCSLVFSAFALETYLNHLGEIEIPYWDEIEGIKALQKLKVLHIHLNMSFDPSCRPIQTAIQLFRFRNVMANGRTVTVTELPGVAGPVLRHAFL